MIPEEALLSSTTDSGANGDRSRSWSQGERTPDSKPPLMTVGAAVQLDDEDVVIVLKVVTLAGIVDGAAVLDSSVDEIEVDSDTK